MRFTHLNIQRSLIQEEIKQKVLSQGKIFKYETDTSSALLRYINEQ